MLDRRQSVVCIFCCLLLPWKFFNNARQHSTHFKKMNIDITKETHLHTVPAVEAFGDIIIIFFLYSAVD